MNGVTKKNEQHELVSPKMNTVPVIQIGQSQLNKEEDETSILRKMKPHVPGIITFADHSRPLPWSVTYHTVVMFADISGFTALCEKYSTDGQSGVDQLTRTLNEYLSALVEGILRSDGDILKFAGDAILAIWRVGRIEELFNEIIKVVQCCLDIQKKCGEWNTDIGIKLTVKIGLSAGEMTVTFLGNQEYRHYVELGPAIKAVNAAEDFCQSGMIVMSPDMFQYCTAEMFQTDTLEDGLHRRVYSIEPVKRKRSMSLPVPSLLEKGTELNARDIPQKSHSDKSYINPGQLPTLVSQADISQDQLRGKPIPTIISESATEDKTDTEKSNQNGDTVAKSSLKLAVKSKLGSKVGKLRKVVETVTEMRLDIALRLYILSPVLKKIDDNQPMEYLSEMRQVSTVFMNLVLEECEDSKDLLQKIFEVVYSKSKALHGCLNKVFLFDKGCTFLVLFGLPGYKHENDSAHALICSGRMKTQLETLSGIQLVSIGVTTGTTFCGVVGHPKRHEYSVIGRKVNMAARLMMHYPGKITCDTDTHQTCRLPPSFFDVLITKRMKGLHNVGIIREFIGASKDENTLAKSITHSDYPMLGRQMDEYQFRSQIANMQKRQHIIYNGPSGIGKTKLLDELISIAIDKDFRVISCRVDLEDSSYPYFVANHILRAILSNKGYSHQIERESHIVDGLGENSNYLYLLNDVMGLEIQKPLSLADHNFDEKKKRKELMRDISNLCLESDDDTAILIDDAHNIDTSSWKLLVELIPIRHSIIVLSLRPSIIEVPTCREAAIFLEHKDVKQCEVGSLDYNFMAPLACQMMDVVSIPKDLDKILRERSHGVPTWCMEILKDMIDQKKLIVVLDDGSKQCQEPSVAPNVQLIKPRSSFSKSGRPSETSIRSVLKVDVTDTKQQIDPGHETEAMVLTDLGYLHEATSGSYRDIQGGSSPRDMGAGYALGHGLIIPTGKQELVRDLKKTEKAQEERIAVFAKGISASDIPVPASMKELIIARLDSMRSSDQLLVKCAAVLGKSVRRDILEMLLPKAHRAKLIRRTRRLMESGIFQCGNTPASQMKRRIKDDSTYQKYRCFCHKDDVQTRSGDPQACFEPVFTNNLLQETAYEILMESQRFELHTKAAHYFELSADEIRGNVPYYILNRPPEESIEEKLASLEGFEPRAARRARNRVSDEVYEKMAAESRARRGRRQAVSMSVEDAIPLVHKVVQLAKPMESIHHSIEMLIPVYENLIFHWQHANNTMKVFQVVLELIPALTYVNRNAKALEMIESGYVMLNDLKTNTDIDSKILLAKLHRLHGKVLYNTGRVTEAFARIKEACSLLDLHVNTSSTRFSAKLIWKFLIYWKLRRTRNLAIDRRSLEKGYCLHDLFLMYKDQGNTDAMFRFAMHQFSKVVGRKVHIHQSVNAFSALIECCREKKWFDTAQMLELELLQSCATKHDELSSEDRGVLGKTYATSCIHFFLNGNLEKADLSGNAAAVICLSIRDRETIIDFVPYYCLLCLIRKMYPQCAEMLQQLKLAAQLTDNQAAKTLYHTLTLEAFLVGGIPPETMEASFDSITKQLKFCDASRYEMTSRYYAAMTTALCCARIECWSRMQIWFDYWEVFETDDPCFFGVMARINKIESMLHSLSKSIEVGNQAVVTQLVPFILHDFSFVEKALHKVKVLKPRVAKLKNVYKMLRKSKRKMKRSTYSDIMFAKENDLKRPSPDENQAFRFRTTRTEMLGKQLEIQD